MKNILIKLLSPYFPSLSTPVLKNKTFLNEIEGVQHCENITMFSNSSSDSVTHFAIQECVNTSKEVLNDLLLINKPNIFSNMVNNFISFHGPNSDKVKRLRIPENSLLDRDINIHTITGSCPHGDEFILKNLRNKESLMSMSDNISTISNSPTPSIISTSSTVDIPITNLDITSLQDIVSCSASVFGG